ncbi:hypothetical protein B5M09_003654 [Aphanomyces astaci]|uniref:WW domain-containing protein n=1 Tax=Aphanomyces astaci TaxID=112090 RepID=A0A3R7X444_APHAT|nr:hypothetical protein B5M09_003654 [Aphanomyces astaci]
MVTKPRLIGVLRTICGIDATKFTSMDGESKALVKHLEGLHYCFESTNTQTSTSTSKLTIDSSTLHMNWRLLLLSLKYEDSHASRIYRGRLGRIQARKQLLDFFATEMAKIQAQRDACAAADRRAAVRRIQVRLMTNPKGFVLCVVPRKRVLQRCYREHKTKVITKQADADNYDYQRVEMEMTRMLQVAERARQDHRAAVTAYFDQVREDTEAKVARDTIDARCVTTSRVRPFHCQGRERHKVVVRRREREWAAILAQRKSKLDAVSTSKRDRKAARDVEWRQKIESRALTRRDKLVQVLLRPNSKDDDTLKTALLVKLDAKYKHIKASYKATGIYMASAEMQDRAQHDVLLDEMEAERARAREEWRVLELQIAKQEQDDADNERVMEIERETNERFRAATCIQRGVKVCLARKLLRSKVERAFEKVYDVPTGQVVYLNTRTNGMCPKPSCLGAKDLPLADKWYICPDISGDVYYYNPKTMRMSWTKPDACVFCDGCSVKFAAVYCPNHMKGRYMDPLNLCAACYDEQVAQGKTIAGCIYIALDVFTF